VGETKPPRVFTFEQMHRFAPTAGPWEPMLRVFADCGLRLGEVLGLERGDFATPSVPAARLTPAGSPSGTSRPRSTSGRFHAAFDGRADSRPAPEDRHAAAVPHTDRPAVARVELQARCVEPARKASGRNIRRHDCRHSWVTQLRAAGIDDADLAQVAGHTVETMLGAYAHPLGRSHDRIRQVIG
jgi:integrase